MDKTDPNSMKEFPMKAYEVYERNQATGDGVMIGILPERRKDRSRATAGSVLNWGRVLLGDKAKNTDIFFVEISLHKTRTGNFFPFSGDLENNIQN
ncbi:MAG: hypothetical protein WA974_18865 [Thermodesulfobacteriota bacterium]